MGAVAGNPVQRETRRRRWLLMLGGIGLLAGFCGGLLRLGWALPHGANLAVLHGPLMISGLGALISLERAVALGARWTYFGPLFVIFGSILLIAGAPPILGITANILASGILAVASVRIARMQPALFTWTMALGALAWIAGNLVWFAGGAFADAAGWWLSFLILTIAGERLEMSRLMPTRRGGKILFAVAVGLLVAGAAIGVTLAAGALLFGSGLLAITVWLLRHDIARRTIRMPGQTRFFAVCMLTGYLWLGVAGFALLLVPPGSLAASYDIAVHAVAIGFVLSMIFGHALIILPAITGLMLRYSAVLYGPLVLLHLSVAVRILAGLLEETSLRAASGALTLLAIVAFAASLIVTRFSKHSPNRHTPRPV